MFAHDVATIMWSYGKLGKEPSAATRTALDAAAAREAANVIPPQDEAMTAGAYARLGKQLPAEVSSVMK